MNYALKAVGCTHFQYHVGAQTQCKRRAGDQLKNRRLTAPITHRLRGVYGSWVGWWAELPASFKSFLFVVFCPLALLERGKDKKLVTEETISDPQGGKEENSEMGKAEGGEKGE